MANHWTNNEDLLADYVLGRIHGARLAELESHLSGCEACRIAVADEKNLAAAARLSGRHQLKVRLEENVKQAPGRTIPWPHIMSAAAVVVIITGVGVYNNWFVAQRSELEIHEEPLASRSEETIGKEELQTKQNVEPVSPKDKATSTQLSKKKRQSDALSGARMSHENLTTQKQADAKVIVSEEAGRAVASPDDMNLTEMEFEDARENPAWVIGTVAQVEAKGENQFDYQREKPAATPRQDVPDRDAMMSRNLRRTNSIRVTQQAFASLPREQQMQQSSGQNTLLAQIQRTRGKLQITLYPEHPFSEDELRRAGSEFIGPDSVLITIGAQKAGYRIPEELREPPIPSKAK